MRPPLHLQGGDYFVDGAGNAFVSEDTITANGGQKRHVEAILRSYFGAKNVPILNALPGTTARHLDMLLKPLSPSVMLYAQPLMPSAKSSVYNKRLSKQVESLQRINLNYLRKTLPELRLVGVASPPILEDSPQLTKDTIRSQLIAVVCEKIGINYLRYQSLAKTTSPERVQGSRMIGKALQEIAGRPLDLSQRVDLDIACQAFLGSGLDALEEFYVANTTVYRTYANSVILRPPGGETISFIPRYKPVEGELQETFDRYGRETEAAYRVAYPEATIHWIDCDNMVRKLGALHCLSMVIPAVP